MEISFFPIPINRVISWKLDHSGKQVQSSRDSLSATFTTEEAYSVVMCEKARTNGTRPTRADMPHEEYAALWAKFIGVIADQDTEWDVATRIATAARNACSEEILPFSAAEPPKLLYDFALLRLRHHMIVGLESRLSRVKLRGHYRNYARMAAQLVTAIERYTHESRKDVLVRIGSLVSPAETKDQCTLVEGLVPTVAALGGIPGELARDFVVDSVQKAKGKTLFYKKEGASRDFATEAAMGYFLHFLMSKCEDHFTAD